MTYAFSAMPHRGIVGCLAGGKVHIPVMRKGKASRANHRKDR